jgi:putative ABC transport system substrate-binding protein
MIKKTLISVFILILSCGSAYSNQKLIILGVKSENIPEEPHNITLSGFKDRLKETSTNASIIECHLQGQKEDDLSKLTQEIKSKRPDLILTMGTTATRLAQDTVKDIPIIFTMVLDPHRSGITVSGVSLDISYETKLEKLKEILPNKTKVGVVYSAQSASLYKELSQASHKLGFEIVGSEINSEREFPDAVQTIFETADCFMMLPDPKIFFPKSIQHLLHESIKSGIPTIGLSSTYTRAGALISFDCDYRDLGEQAADLTLEILAANKSKQAKFVRPRKAKYSLNLVVAERLGIKLLSETIKQASEVFGK